MCDVFFTCSTVPQLLHSGLCEPMFMFYPIYLENIDIYFKVLSSASAHFSRMNGCIAY